MAELATIARPYAEALDQSVNGADALALIPQLQALAAVAGHPDMLQLADNPKVKPQQVLDVLTGVAKTPLDPKVSNLLRTVVDNGRLAALPEIAAQFNALVKSRSGTSDEARLRQEEADLILRWVDRAKKVEPNGQVVISQSADAGDLLLENGDILRVPVRDGVVLVSGEVLFPNAVAFSGNLSVRDYIERAGGFTNKADTSRIIVARQDGSFAEAKPNSKVLKFGSRTSSLDSGDEILVLPRIDVKSRQIFKDMTQILYQIAIGAKVALGI